MLLVAFRADVKDGVREKLSSWLSQNASSFLVVYEDPNGNPHVHGIIQADCDNIRGIRQSFTRRFPELVGNSGYSMKLCDDNFDAYIRYICKGVDVDHPPVVWFRQGLDYSEEVVLAAHKKYYVNQAAVKENAEKRAKVDKESIIEQIEKECKRKKIKGYDRVEIAKVYLNLFRDARKGVNLFAAKAVVNTVSMLLEGGDAEKESLARKIAEL